MKTFQTAEIALTQLIVDLVFYVIEKTDEIHTHRK